MKSVARAEAFINNIQKENVFLKKLLHHSIHGPSLQECNKVREACFKKGGYLSRLFSNEPVWELFEPRTALGQVFRELTNYIEGNCRKLDSTTIRKANEEAKRCLKGLGWILGIFSFISQASGQVMVGSEFRINTHLPNNQHRAQAAVLANGNVVVVWESELQDNSFRGVYAKIIDRSGNEIVPEFRVNTETNDEQYAPDVASDDKGNFIVVWSSNEQDGPNNTSVFAQKYNQTGSKIGGEFRINTTIPGRQGYPSVIYLPNGDKFVVAWQDYGSETSSWGVYSQIFYVNTTKFGGEIHVNMKYTNGDQSRPKLFVFPTENWGILWHSQFQDTSEYGVFGSVYSGNGTLVSDSFQINTYFTGTQAWPDVVSMSSNQFFAIWESENQIDNKDIFGQILFQNMSKVNDELLINTETIGDQGQSAVTYCQEHLYTVWEMNDISGQILYRNGTKIGSEVAVNNRTNGQQRRPDVVCFNDTYFLVIWDGLDTDNSVSIFGQLFKDNSYESTSSTTGTTDFVKTQPATTFGTTRFQTKTSPTPVFSTAGSTTTLTTSLVGITTGLNAFSNSSSASWISPLVVGGTAICLTCVFAGVVYYVYKKRPWEKFSEGKESNNVELSDKQESRESYVNVLKDQNEDSNSEYARYLDKDSNYGNMWPEKPKSDYNNPPKIENKKEYVNFPKEEINKEKVYVNFPNEKIESSEIHYDNFPKVETKKEYANIPKEEIKNEKVYVNVPTKKLEISENHYDNLPKEEKD